MMMMAKYRGPMDEVVAAMMKPTRATHSDPVICQNLSPVLSACHALSEEVITQSM